MFQQLLVCTDLDRTVIPNGEQPESPNSRSLFGQFVSHPQVTLAYVTGRDQVLVKEAIALYQLPTPDFVIADVGSTIYQISDQGEWLRLQDWDHQLALTWPSCTHQDLVQLLADLKSCKLQEPEKQGLHKLSYYVSLEADIEALITTIRSRLESQEVNANIIWSIDEKAKIGLLDILPANANKKLAIEFVMKFENFSLDNTVFAGDSGNDLDVLISPIKSILVANAPRDLKTKIQTQLRDNIFQDSVYIAQGSYLNMNGNYSSGILEGIAYYFPDLKF